MSLFFFVLDRCSFSESIRRSLRVIRRRRIRTAVLIVLWRFLSRLVFNIIPRAAVFILHGFLFLIIGEREGFAPASAFVLKQVMLPLLEMISAVMLTASVIAYAFILYKEYRKEDGYGENLISPENSIRESSHRSCRLLIIAVYTATVLSSAVLTAGFTLLIDNDPSVALELLPKTKVAAHRGYSGIRPESTIPAYDAAFECGAADYGEMDVHPSKDGVPIVMHDPNTLRTTGLDADISSLTLDKIKQYNENIRCGLVMPVAVGGYYDLPYLDFFSVEHTFVTSSMVEAVHDRGREVFAWTVNDDKFIREMADCGVDCIIGNFPERIYEIIHRNDNEIDSFINSSLLLPDDDRIIVTPEDISDSAAGPDITPDNES